MNDFIKQQGVAFFIIYLKKYNEFYLMPFELCRKFYEGSKNGERKSIPYTVIKEKCYEILVETDYYIHYLKPLQIYVDSV
ncbi:MAG: hypothetical protein ATN32_02840 [Candidatus Epulonipiscium fishelsonii]|nr:MAG: hypothetical protein ATN32_02840 [Epulopiscium sp. AS2M-Bin002]